MCLIEKKTNRYEAFNRPYFIYDRARDGFQVFLEAAGLKKNERVLMPSYIGWSSREGSGVFDPVNKLKLGYEFYKVTSELEIDIESLRNAFKNNNVRVLVIIHYFGYVDKNYEEAIAIARNYGALVLEDEAHALLTDIIGGISGRMGDACIFSLHKMLPMNAGGMLVFNNTSHKLISKITIHKKKDPAPWQYDLKRIAEKRIHNVGILSRMLMPLRKIKRLRVKLKPGEIPQTYPIIVDRAVRDALYFDLNSSGYGAVSLYHSMIQQLDKKKYPDSFQLSDTILNLPVHQDIEEPMLRSMVTKIKELLYR